MRTLACKFVDGGLAGRCAVMVLGSCSLPGLEEGVLCPAGGYCTTLVAKDIMCRYRSWLECGVFIESTGQIAPWFGGCLRLPIGNCTRLEWMRTREYKCVQIPGLLLKIDTTTLDFSYISTIKGQIARSLRSNAASVPELTPQLTARWSVIPRLLRVPSLPRSSEQSRLDLTLLSCYSCCYQRRLVSSSLTSTILPTTIPQPSQPPPPSPHSANVLAPAESPASRPHSHPPSRPLQ